MVLGSYTIYVASLLSDLSPVIVATLALMDLPESAPALNCWRCVTTGLSTPEAILQEMPRVDPRAPKCPTLIKVQVLLALKNTDTISVAISCV